MGKATFRFLDRTQAEVILPQMFDILFTNMSKIAPTDGSYDEDRRMWMAYMTSEAGRDRQIVLMYVDEVLAGYFQYSVKKDTMLIEEIEIKPEYQRSLLFYRFFKYISNVIPVDAVYVEAYINKENKVSMANADKLGMRIAGENKAGTSWLYRGEARKFKLPLR